MKDEIKEILNWLNQIIKENKESDVSLKSCVVPFETLYKLQDYITNLQEENERLKEERQNINNRNYNQKIANRKLMEDIEKLRTNLKTNKRRRKKQTHKKNIYKSRNEKAIECINHYAVENEDYSKIYNDEEKDLLNILNGDNK